MAHIALEEGVPGIVAAFGFRPETAKPMRELAEILLRGPEFADERGTGGDCGGGFEWERVPFLPALAQRSGGGAPRGRRGRLRVDRKGEGESGGGGGFAEIAGAAAIASKVREGGKKVTAADVAAAREQGATDVEIHDTVLIAAAFSNVQPLRGWAGDVAAGGRGELSADGQADGAGRVCAASWSEKLLARDC